MSASIESQKGDLSSSHLPAALTVKVILDFTTISLSSVSLSLEENAASAMGLYPGAIQLWNFSMGQVIFLSYGDLG